jgi:hypothetical protein
VLISHCGVLARIIHLDRVPYRLRRADGMNAIDRWAIVDA